MTRIEASINCPIFSGIDGCKLDHDVHIGIFGDDVGVSMVDPADSNTRPLLGIFPNLKSTDTALSANGCLAGIHSRFLVSKAQTNINTIVGAELQCRLKASVVAGVRAGVWAYWEQSGTVVCNGGIDGAAMMTVESSSALTATTLVGANIDSSVNASASVTNFSAIRISTATSAKPFDYLIDVSTGGAPVVGVMRLTAVSGVVVSSGGLTKTEAGYLIVYIGSSKRYIPLYSA